MIVQKFGGSSLATRELREIAIGRVLAAARERRDPVVVVSALGRAPSPYSTDALAALVGSAPGSANRDLVLACGELISAGLFAEELCARGVRATALSGAQAGIVTDDAHGDAEIVAVRPVLLERLVAEARRRGTPAEIEVEGREPALPPDFALSLYRVAQEALTNAEHHARAQHVGLRLDFSDSSAVLVVEDDGVGFVVGDAAASEANAHLGLLGMRERLQLVGGTLEITSAVGEGTTVAAAVRL
jgi:signal transduction histidine kinase